jgi:23S rRNA (adenine2030-N6)-methyltransferase
MVNEKLTQVDEAYSPRQSKIMNYRHAFHAGNHGDVLKHVLLARVLTYLTQKDAALAVLDAHAGIGLYDLTSLEAIKTGEWRGGIGKVLDAKLGDDVAEVMQPYLNVVREVNKSGVLQFYPGSPEIARRLLRPKDRLLLNELHPQDHETLAARFGIFTQVRLSQVDALQAVKAFLPFPEKRGLVLIDPAFEVVDESQRVARMVEQALRRMAQVCMMIWYPVTTQKFADDFCDGLRFEGAKSALRAEVLVRPPQEGSGLAGSGVVIVNPPWTLYEEATKILPALAHTMGESKLGKHRLTWIVEPK